MNLLLISFEGLALRTVQHSKTSDDIFTDILLLLFVGRESSKYKQYQEGRRERHYRQQTTLGQGKPLK